MFDNATLSQLRDLRLQAMADDFREQRNSSGMASLSFEERFGLLVEAEWLRRRNKRTERLIRQADFRFPAAIEDIDFQGKKGITKPEIIKLSLGSYIRKAQNIFFSGPTGVGKTYLACALGRAACIQGFQVIYIRLPDFFRRAFAAQADRRKTPFRDRCVKVPLLILDDWGLKKFSLEETDELSELVEKRNNQGSTIVSGQVPYTSWHELFPDPTQAESILDRIIHNTHIYNVTGESMRKAIGKRSLESPD